MPPRDVNVRGESQNESTPADQRKPNRTTELSEGPKTGKAGEYLPALYPTNPRNGQKTGNVREDR